MKKLVTALVVLALVLTMAPAAFAADNQYDTALESVTMVEGDTVQFYLGMEYVGQTLTVENAYGLVAWCGMMGQQAYADPVTGILTLYLEQSAPNGVNVRMYTTNTEATTYTLSWGAATVQGSGTQNDPYQGIGSTVSIPAGQTVYFALPSANNGKQLVISDLMGEITVGSLMGAAYDSYNGTTTVTLNQNSPMYIMFSLSSSATTDKEYSVEIKDPVGSFTNPEQMTTLPTSAVSYYMIDGAYQIEYTSAEPGYLTITVADTWGSTDFDVEVYSSGVGSKWASDSADKKTVTVGVLANSTVSIVAKTYDNTVALDLSYSWAPAAEGDQVNPAMGFVDANGQMTTVEIPAGGSYYYSMMGIGGTTIKIDDPDAQIWYSYATYNAQEGVAIFGSPMLRMPETIGIINNGTTAKTFTLVSYVPVGTFDNPEVITDLSKVEFSLEEGNDQGYTYSYTATADGKVTLALNDAALSGKVNLILNNLTSYENQSLIYWDDAASKDVVGDTVSIDVKEGEVITIMVVAVPDDMWVYAAAEGSFGVPGNPKTGDSALLSTAAVMMVVAAAAFVTLKRKAI